MVYGRSVLRSGIVTPDSLQLFVRQLRQLTRFLSEVERDVDNLPE